MKIGIYKPFKPIYFKDDQNDYASWSNEVINICKILHKYTNAEIHVLSQSDLQPGEQHHIFQQGHFDKMYDRIIVFNGGKEENHEEKLKLLRSMTTRLDFIVTDLKLRNYDEDLFDNIYTQSPKLYKYGAIEKACVFEYEPDDISIEDLKNREHRYVFGGAEHNRVNDFIEYIWRPDCKIYGKSELLSINNRIGYSQFMNIMKNAKYSITIADDDYNKIGFVTPRVYENIMSNVLGFVDMKYDKYTTIMSKTNILRVDSYRTMLDKMKMFDADPVLAHDTLSQQKQIIASKYSDGSFVYEHIK